MTAFFIVTLIVLAIIIWSTIKGIIFEPYDNYFDHDDWNH